MVFMQSWKNKKGNNTANNQWLYLTAGAPSKIHSWLTLSSSLDYRYTVLDIPTASEPWCYMQNKI